MALMHFRLTHRSRGNAQAPAAAHARYMLRTTEGPAAAHVEYVVRSASSVADREDLVASGAGNLPSWAHNDPVAFFAAADTYERINGRVCTQIEAALPRELTVEQQKAVVQDFVTSQLGTHHAYVWAIHETTARDGQGNPHMHLAFSERRDPGREISPQEYFSRSGATKDREFHAQGYVATARQAWSDVVNTHLERAGMSARVDPRSFQEQGVAQVPTERVRVQDVQRAKYHGHETPGWQATVAQRERSGGPDAAKGQQYWEARKAALGITAGMAHAEALQRITVASRERQPVTREPMSLNTAKEAVQKAQERVHRVHAGVLLAQSGSTSPAVTAKINQILHEDEALRRNRYQIDLEHPGKEPARDRGQGRGW